MWRQTVSGGLNARSFAGFLIQERPKRPGASSVRIGHRAFEVASAPKFEYFLSDDLIA